MAVIFPIQLKRGFLIKTIFGFLSILCFINLACASTSKQTNDFPPLETVPFVDIERYMGTWYEIGRLPQWFQRDCWASQAIYELHKSGKVKVLNRCQKLDNPQDIDDAKGVARVVDEETNAKLKVSFVPLFKWWGWFSGDYWVLALDDDYQFVMVGAPSRESLWILSRSKTLDEIIVNELLDQAARDGFPVKDFELSPVWSAD